MNAKARGKFTRQLRRLLREAARHGLIVEHVSIVNDEPVSCCVVYPTPKGKGHLGDGDWLLVNVDPDFADEGPDQGYFRKHKKGAG